MSLLGLMSTKSMVKQLMSALPALDAKTIQEFSSHMTKEEKAKLLTAIEMIRTELTRS